jgi:pimeloyl-ACP methyl ester carboxylesterase
MSMENPRKYGKPPFSIAVLHGGPGAPGEMAPVAKELSSSWGVLEPLQTAISIEGQVRELKMILDENGSLPVVLIGWSWGAMLGYIFTAKYPSRVKKLIMIGSAVFDKKYNVKLTKIRFDRLSSKDRTQALDLMERLIDPYTADKDAVMYRFGKLLSKADSYSPVYYRREEMKCQYRVFEGVWKDAASLRDSGRLLNMGKLIECPVIAIHGDYDPHPIEGVREPLSGVLKDFRFIILKKCGHQPWVERFAKGRFYQILKEELK